MTLDTENAKLFFKLFLPMLDYVNLKCHVLENDEKFMEKLKLSLEENQTIFQISKLEISEKIFGIKMAFQKYGTKLI